MADVTFDSNAKQFNDFLRQFVEQGSAVESTINDYLHNVAGRKIASSIEGIVPVSDRNKKHARNSAPFGRQENYNLAVKVMTNKEFNYLVFPDEALGTSKGKTPQDFTGRGLEAVMPELIDEMTALITKQFL
jgi:hypothetical protein